MKMLPLWGKERNMIIDSLLLVALVALGLYIAYRWKNRT